MVHSWQVSVRVLMLVRLGVFNLKEKVLICQ